MFFLHLLIIVIYITCLILAGFVLHSSSLSSSSVHHCCSQNFVDDVIFLTTPVNLSILRFFLCVSLPVPSTLLVFPLLTVTAFLISSCLFIPPRFHSAPSCSSAGSPSLFPFVFHMILYSHFPLPLYLFLHVALFSPSLCK